MALTQVQPAMLASDSQYTGFKNRIINGAMVIDQRNAGASVTPANGANTYTVDRWAGYANQSSKYTVQQNAGSVTPPAGFRNYLGATSSSAYSITSSDIFLLRQSIEGFNTADFNWGTANASTVTLSFYVRSSLTGTFGGSINNDSGNRFYPFSYTISAANTWEQKSVTIAGDTTGTWYTTNSGGLWLNFSLGTGSSNLQTAGSWTASSAYGATGQTNLVGTNGATFYITGVQLEKGSTATSFDYRPYGTELALCQRYYMLFGAVTGTYYTTGNSVYAGLTYSMRTKPSVSLKGTIGLNNMVGTLPGTLTGTVTLDPANINGGCFYGGYTGGSGLSNGTGVILQASNGTTDGIALSAEL